MLCLARQLGENFHVLLRTRTRTRIPWPTPSLPLGMVVYPTRDRCIHRWLLVAPAWVDLLAMDSTGLHRGVVIRRWSQPSRMVCCCFGFLAGHRQLRQSISTTALLDRSVAAWLSGLCYRHQSSVECQLHTWPHLMPSRALRN